MNKDVRQCITKPLTDYAGVQYPKPRGVSSCGGSRFHYHQVSRLDDPVLPLLTGRDDLRTLL